MSTVLIFNGNRRAQMKISRFYKNMFGVKILKCAKFKAWIEKCAIFQVKF